MIISTFELLLKSQLPSGTPGVVSNLSRNVIQGYFLTIANLSAVDLALSLVFTTRLPGGTTLADVISFVDTSGLNNSLAPVQLGNKIRYSPIILPIEATSLFILQPVPTDAAIAALNFEIRGYVDISPSSLSGILPPGVQIQVTAEQRGTFFSDANAANIADRSLDQIAYGLTVQNGGLLTLT
ncbi:MAG: hypothetical protein KME17_24215 [Cyanosarcina radialis HA8281-LM2]|jgi:hypothetical protein|nr:hypothetical protein [Cyanosarcina radialis HA8281-LM2]